VKNIKFLNLEGNKNTKNIVDKANLFNKEVNKSLTLPNIIDVDKKNNNNNNDNKNINISGKLFSSMDNKYNKNKKY
jgi:hypothetical protein